MQVNFAVVLAVIVVSAAALFAMLLLGHFLRPRRFDPVKATTYECGEKPFGQAWFSFNNRFYVIALVFIVFDVEVVLTFPAVVVFRKLVGQGLGWLAFMEIALFLLILLGVLVYAWARGDLKWVKDIEPPTCAPVDTAPAAKEDNP